MDAFSVCLDALSLVGQAVTHLLFVLRLTGKRRKLWYFAGYLSLLCAIELGFRRFVPGGGVLPVGAGILALYGMVRFALGKRRSASWLAAVLAFYVSQLSFGIVNSVESAFFAPFVGSPLLYPLLLAALAGGFALCAGCYAAVLRLLSLEEDQPPPRMGLLLFPGLFSLAAELYILRTSYSFPTSSLPPEEAGRHGALLFLQIMGLAALQALAQAAQAQRAYIAEAQARYERTRSFRHDIKSHLSVLSGLLGSGRTEECRAYLNRLEAASASLSFPYQTGSPVVDILLGEKLGLASDIRVEVSLVLPRPCRIDQFDLCVIFANALDNAIAACRACREERFIRIAGKRQGDFYLLEIENACPEGPLPPAGTGLSNIRAAAEKYGGAAVAEKRGRCFSLSVLLNIS